jgi:hypothetical protein
MSLGHNNLGIDESLYTTAIKQLGGYLKTLFPKFSHGDPLEFFDIRYGHLGQEIKIRDMRDFERLAKMSKRNRIDLSEYRISISYKHEDCILGETPFPDLAKDTDRILGLWAIVDRHGNQELKQRFHRSRKLTEDAINEYEERGQKLKPDWSAVTDMKDTTFFSKGLIKWTMRVFMASMFALPFLHAASVVCQPPQVIIDGKITAEENVGTEKYEAEGKIFRVKKLSKMKYYTNAEDKDAPEGSNLTGRYINIALDLLFGRALTPQDYVLLLVHNLQDKTTCLTNGDGTDYRGLRDPFHLFLRQFRIDFRDWEIGFNSSPDVPYTHLCFEAIYDYKELISKLPGISLEARQDLLARVEAHFNNSEYMGVHCAMGAPGPHVYGNPTLSDVRHPHQFQMYPKSHPIVSSSQSLSNSGNETPESLSTLPKQSTWSYAKWIASSIFKGGTSVASRNKGAIVNFVRNFPKK